MIWKHNAILFLVLSLVASQMRGGDTVVQKSADFQKFQPDALTTVLVKLEGVLTTWRTAAWKPGDPAFPDGTKVLKQTYNVVAVQNGRETPLGTYVYALPAGVATGSQTGFEIDDVIIKGKELIYI
ncbi:MAG TPA: hypothetical protein VG733_00790, partial [Chthoniobacteraceae bacterium]|nr:hypothetical protein [Chthoniobacteraceae bacterium]